MKNKIINFFIIAFCLLFLNFPISYSLTNVKYVFLFVAILALVIYFLNRQKGNSKLIVTDEKEYFIIIIILSIVTRIGIVFALNSRITQISDFEIALNTAYTWDISDAYHSIFSHWNLYPLIVGVFCRIFGNYQMVVLMFNACINILSCIMIYVLANLIFDDKKYGFVASFIYIIWPANILYTLILTQEHVAILLLLIAIYIFLYSEKYITEKYKYGFIAYALLGVALGISIFFKNFSYVLFIAFAMFHIAIAFTKKKSLKFLINRIPLYIIMIITFLITQGLIYNMLDNMAGRKVSRNLLPYTLNIGLRNDGHFDRKTANRYKDLAAENNFDFDKTNETIMSELTEHIINKNSEIHSYSFWENKVKLIFEEDNGRMHFINLSLGNHQKVISVIDIISRFNNIFFVLIAFLMVVGSISVIYNKNLKLILIMLIIHGSSLTLLLIESQNRYKYPLYPFMCIVSTLGLIKLIKIIQKNKFIN